MEKHWSLVSFSIGNNQLTDLDEAAKYLRHFKNLRMLNMQGNPLSKISNYQTIILAHCRNLRYLDYFLMDSATIEAAVSACREELMALEEAEKKDIEESEAAKALQQEETRMGQANMAGLLTLFEELMAEDPESRTVSQFLEFSEFSALREAVDKYKTRFAEIVDEMKEKMFTQQSKKTAEIDEFQRTLKAAKFEADQTCKAMMRSFEKEKKKCSSNPNATSEEWLRLRDQLETLQEDLMEIEVDMSEAFSENHDGIVAEFNRQFKDHTEQTIEVIIFFCNKLREEEKIYYGEISEIFTKLIEQRHADNQAAQAAGGGDLKEGGETKANPADSTRLNDDGYKSALALLENKDDVHKLLSEGHDAHVQKLYAKEEAYVAAEKQQLDELQQELSRKEKDRNRSKVCEINMYVSLMLQDIAAALDNLRDS
eukprot:NODE_587_length_1947_cov_36.566913_g470_i0.p1 GENE.NODE_587_length_1947_cov_36.566913_g470_i0~~NODE_587_length_1947_cov_36.566913_g470_i0.p1  ORF type:complete len:427 (-),score=153.62 NODE_587_length_1947_cov_36.566913_g470_i0:40-1320(-)